jgi:hypothetical protein
MPEPPQPSVFDFTRFSEGTRRRLYDRISEIVFAAPEAGSTLDVDEPPALPERLAPGPAPWTT